MSETILDTAEAEGLDVIVATHRHVLADLFHSARDLPVALFAVPPEGRAPHHYALKFPYPGGGEDMLLGRPKTAAPCDAAQVVVQVAPDRGAYRNNAQVLYRAPGNCY